MFHPQLQMVPIASLVASITRDGLAQDADDTFCVL